MHKSELFLGISTFSDLSYPLTREANARDFNMLQVTINLVQCHGRPCSGCLGGCMEVLHPNA